MVRTQINAASVTFKKCFSKAVFMTAFSVVLVHSGSAYANHHNLETTTHSAVNMSLSIDELSWVADGIYANECASKPENLIHWGDGEEFPSLGIAHFIWYPSGFNGRFVETFPDMIAYVSEFKEPPKWLSQLKPFKAPWSSKQELKMQRDSADLLALQDWLLKTKAYQAEFITMQLNERFKSYLKQLHDNKQAEVLSLLFEAMKGFKKGRFALIDYVNFKGIGAPQEQYQGEQWGLISVFHEMLNMEPKIDELNEHQLLQNFVQAAKKRLQLRVYLAPVERNEKRWIPGWFKRLESYL